MLPDFEAMLSVPLLEVRDPDIQRGIDLHHRTDEAFHGTATFLALCASTLAELTDLGVRRGTARAVGHIGSEMFLDGYLVRDEAHVDLYLAALQTEVKGRLEWRDRGRAFSKLRARLTKWGAPRDYAEPSFVLARLADVLNRRPALAVPEEESTLVAKFLPSLQQMVEGKAPELLHELRDALGLRR
jgi:hypothetical protein